MILGVSGRIGSGKDTVGKIIQYLTWCESVNSSDLPTFEEWDTDNALTNARIITTTLGYGGWEIKKYAGKLKQIVSLLTGCKVEDLEDQDFKSKHLSSEWSWWVQKESIAGMSHVRMTPKFESQEAADEELKNVHRYQGAGMGINNYRAFLQIIGTDAMRDIVHRNVWVNALFADYKPRRLNKYDQGKLERIDCEEDFPNWIITDCRFLNEARAIKERGGIIIRVNRGELDTREVSHASETALDYYPFDYIIDNNSSMSALIDNVDQILRKEKIIK